MVNLQNIFVMEVFVVQTYPVTVGSCFHYPLQGIMDLSHEGLHSLEMVMELIVNWERASFHKGRRWSTLQNIFVMEVFVVQTYPVTVGSCFHYPLQGIMDLFHEGLHSLEMLIELIVNYEWQVFTKEGDGQPSRTYL
jgi:hypothetical protein